MDNRNDASGAGAQAQQHGEAPTPVLRRAVLAASLGNATEWYDYGIYAYLVGELTTNFFPGPFGLIAALLVYAVSFILRPLGGMIWGPLGDRYGRRTVMSLTIILMAGGTFLIGVLPNYAAIGIWAPILLIALRVIQGFSTGGEYGGAATFMAEYAPDKKRGFWGSFLEFGTLGGFSLGVIITFGLRLFLTEPEMTAWGWRIPFFVALPLGLVGLYLRYRLEDTPVYNELVTTKEIPVNARGAFAELFRNYKRPMLQLFGLVIALNVSDYMLLTYMPTFMSQTLKISDTETDMIVLIGQLVMMALIWIAGSASDRFGRKPLWWFSLIGVFVLAIPCFWLMHLGFGWAIVGFTVLGLVFLPQLGTISATFPAMFPAHVRYAGMAISYNVSTAIFGGTVAVVNEALVTSTGNSYMPAFYTMAACVVGMIALITVTETAGASIRGRKTPARQPQPARVN